MCIQPSSSSLLWILFAWVLLPTAQPGTAADESHVWRVGRRPTDQFQEIQPAIDVAEPGDRILVTPDPDGEPYRQFEVTKPIRISSTGGERFRLSWSTKGPDIESTIWIHDSQSAGEIIVSHVEIVEDTSITMLCLERNRTPVTILNLHLAQTEYSALRRRVVVEECEDVLLSELDGSFYPRMNMEIAKSTVELYRPRMFGVDLALLDPPVYIPVIRARSSNVTMFGPHIVGGLAGGDFTERIPGPAALEVSNGTAARLVGILTGESEFGRDVLRGGKYWNYGECIAWTCCDYGCYEWCCSEVKWEVFPGGPGLEALRSANVLVQGVELVSRDSSVPGSFADESSRIEVEPLPAPASLDKYDLGCGQAVGEPLRLLVRGRPRETGTLFVSDGPRLYAQQPWEPVGPRGTRRRVAAPFLSKHDFVLPATGKLHLEVELPLDSSFVGRTLIAQAMVSRRPFANPSLYVWTNALPITIIETLGQRIFEDHFDDEQLDPENWQEVVTARVIQSPSMAPSAPFCLEMDPEPSWSHDRVKTRELDLSSANEAFIAFSIRSNSTLEFPAGSLSMTFRDIDGRWQTIHLEDYAMPGPYWRRIIRLPSEALIDSTALQFAVRDFPSGIAHDWYLDDVTVYVR